MELKFKSLSGSLPYLCNRLTSGMNLRVFIDEPVLYNLWRGDDPIGDYLFKFQKVMKDKLEQDLD